MRALVRVGLGGLVTALGIAVWLLLWARLEPVAMGALPAEAGGVPFWMHEQAMSIGLRWSAVALAVGGLLLAARTWRAGRWLAAGVGVAWLGLDAGLDLYNVNSRLGPAVTAASVGVAAVALLAASLRRGGGAGPAWPLLIGAGVLVAQQPDEFVLRRSDEISPAVATLILILGWALTIAAAVLALAAGPWPPTRGRAWGAALVLGLALLLVVGAVSVSAQDGRNSFPAVLVLRSFSWWLPPVLVALTGILPRRGRGVRVYLALTLGCFLVVSSISFGREWPTLLGVHALGHGYPWARAAGVLVGALLVGVVLLVATGLTRRVANPIPADAAAGRRSPMASGGWRFAAGGFLAGAGLAAWLVTAGHLQPQIAALVAGWRSPADGVFRATLQGQNDVDGFGWDLRWACIALAAAGLRLLARDRRRRRIVVVAVATWCAAEFALLSMSVASPPGAPRSSGIGATLAVVGVAVLIARRLPGRASPPLASGGAGRDFVYASAVAGVAVFSLHSVRPLITENLPTGGLAGALGLSVLLVVAAVLTALAAAPAPVRPARVLAAVVVAIGGGAAVLALGGWRLTGSYIGRGGGPDLARLLVPAAVLGALVLACALIAGVLPAVRSAAGAGLVAVASPAVAVGATGVAWAPMLLGFLVLPHLSALTGPFTIDESATPLTLTGVAAGVTLAILALLPRELSTMDTPPVPAGPAVPPRPPAPVAVPGVPEVLDSHPASVRIG